MKFLVEEKFTNLDHTRNIIWDSYETYVSPFSRWHKHTFIVQVKMENVERIFVNLGPGKFSSLRISISISKAISLAKNISLFGFESKFIENGNYKKLLELDSKNLVINDLIKPLYSS